MQKFNHSNESHDQLHKLCELIYINGFMNHHIMDLSKLVLKKTFSKVLIWTYHNLVLKLSINIFNSLRYRLRGSKYRNWKKNLRLNYVKTKEQESKLCFNVKSVNCTWKCDHKMQNC